MTFSSGFMTCILRHPAEYRGRMPDLSPLPDLMQLEESSTRAQPIFCCRSPNVLVLSCRVAGRNGQRAAAATSHGPMYRYFSGLQWRLCSRAALESRDTVIDLHLSYCVCNNEIAYLRLPIFYVQHATHTCAAAAFGYHHY